MGSVIIIIIIYHYRRDSTDSLYFEQLIKSKMQLWELYKQWLSENHPGETPVKLHYYVDTLTKHFHHLHITKPKSDTCKICDEAFLKLNDRVISFEDRRKLQISLDLHQVN